MMTNYRKQNGGIYRSINALLCEVITILCALIVNVVFLAASCILMNSRYLITVQPQPFSITIWTECCIDLCIVCSLCLAVGLSPYLWATRLCRQPASSWLLDIHDSFIEVDVGGGGLFTLLQFLQ